MRLRVDTAAFIWAIGAPRRMSRAATAALADPAAKRTLSPLSAAEMAIKRAKGKLAIGAEEVTRGLAALKIEVLPFTIRHADALFDLPQHHNHPFDRQIIAPGLAEGLPVVTPDRTFRLYRGLKVIW